jgi:hypothetical protein
MHEDLTRKAKVKTPKERSFGLVMAAFFCLIALVPLLHRPAGSPRLWALAIAAAFAVLAVVYPASLKQLNRLWMQFGLLLHKITSPIILGVMFYGVIVPVGVTMRLVGKDPLRLKREPESQSYWIVRAPGPAPQSMKQQF